MAPSISTDQLALPAKRKDVLNETNTNMLPAKKRLATVANHKRASKTTFEEDLDRLTQEIKEAAQDGNAETDQKWSRPRLDSINPLRDTIIFQQIELDESVDMKGPTIRMFGVSEVLTNPIQATMV